MGKNDFSHMLRKNYFSDKAWAKIQKTRIGIAGAGGLGSNVAVALVRSGFKYFEIIDFDKVELSNLNRQQYFLPQVGKFKIEALKENLLSINPDLDITGHTIKLTSQNALNYFADSDIIFEAFDKVEFKKLILEAYGNTKKIIISGNGMAGASNKNELKIRKISSLHFLVGDGVSSVSEEPVFAPRVAACAALMASVALEIIIGNDYQ
ncbi:sulfur carrier protein ThiS adenylyltransferase ThiF [Candidatus Margulisiibacteriota bacterium]